MTIQRKNIKCPNAPHKASRPVSKYVYVQTNITVCPERPIKAPRPSSRILYKQTNTTVCPDAPRKKISKSQCELKVHHPIRLFK